MTYQHDLNESMLSAAIQGNYHEVLYWLERGADINSQTKHGSTALTRLIVSSHRMPSNVIDLLVKKGANIHAQDHDGFTALMLAAYHGKKEHMHVLLRYGADASQADYFGRTAIEHANIKNQHSIKNELIDLLNVFVESKKLLDELYNDVWPEVIKAA